jgi:TRAP transporter TAXI family solute receptor
MKKTAFLVAAAIGAATASLPAQAQQFVNILTGGTSGVYYPLGVALSNVYAKALPNAKVSVQATNASVENLNLLQNGRGELAFTLGDSLSDAWNGKADAGFAQPLKKLRAVSAIYPNYVQIVATASSGIKTIADIKGKRISVGAPKSGTELNARAVTRAAGLAYSDFSKVEYLPFGDSVDLMKNRQLDLTLQSAGLGVASIKDLATSVDIVIVPVPGDVVQKIGDPAYQATVIPANTYRGQTADVPAIAIQNFLVTREEVPAETVHAMLAALYDNLPAMVAAHSAARDIKLEGAVKGVPIPLHPGAEKFFREKGVLK